MAAGGATSAVLGNGAVTEAQALTWIAELFAEPPEAITPGTKRDDVRDWDSLGVLTLIAGLDEKFQLVLADGQAQGMSSVKDILDVLRANGRLTD
jgi:acyl carrier protein